MSTRYRVYITPLVNNTVYGTEVDVSDYVKVDGVAQLRRGIDSDNYDVGLYTFGDIQISALNIDGKLNDSNDSRSMFPYSRDLAKVRIEFYDGSASTTFRGLINEEATRQDLTTEQVIFKVLSLDSVLRNTMISGGAFANGVTVSAALAVILNVPAITKVLTFSALEINPTYNLTIDLASAFDNQSVKTMLDQLMIASNSVFTIDSTNTMVVKSRDADTTRAVVNLFGKSDIYARENIMDLFDFNTGRHRMFTSVKVNNQVATNTALSGEFGFRQKSFTFAFMTNTTTALTVATTLVNEFSAPKYETQVTISTHLAKTIEILDRVSINYPVRIQPIRGTFAPIIGITVIGDPTEPLPQTHGSLVIQPEIAWKVIQIQEDPQNFLTTLKLRQVGSGLSDGQFNYAQNSIVGFAVVGEALIA